MSPQEFVSGLQQFTHSKEYYLDESLDEESADQHSKYNVLKRLTTPKKVLVEEPYLEELFSNYDLSSFEVSFTKFTDIPYDLGDSIHFADDGPYYLVVWKSTGEVLMKNSQCEEEYSNKCAKNVECFLGVLLIVEEYNSRNGIYEHDVHDVSEARIFCQRCIETAGGEKYIDYCISLFDESIYR